MTSKEALAEDVVAVLRAELAELAAEGADFVQFDEPVLTELAFAPGSTRTFMCAALAARRDPAEELELAVSLHQPRGRGHSRRADRRARVPRQLEPRRNDAAVRRLSAAGALSRAPERGAARARVRDRSRRRSHVVRRERAGPGCGQPEDRRGRIERRHPREPSRTRFASTRPTGSSSIPTAASARSRAGR